MASHSSLCNPSLRQPGAGLKPREAGLRGRGTPHLSVWYSAGGAQPDRQEHHAAGPGAPSQSDRILRLRGRHQESGPIHAKGQDLDEIAQPDAAVARLATVTFPRSALPASLLSTATRHGSIDGERRTLPMEVSLATLEPTLPEDLRHLVKTALGAVLALAARVANSSRDSR